MRRGPRAIAVAVIAIVAGCKTDDAKPTPPPPPPPAPARVSTQAPPQAPVARSQAPQPDALLDVILLNEPRFVDAVVLAPLKVADGGGRAHQSWCLPAGDALVIAEDLAKALTAAGWRDAHARGTAERAGTSAVIDAGGRYQISLAVGGRDAACTGVVATAQYSTSTLTIPPLAEGERIR